MVVVGGTLVHTEAFVRHAGLLRLWARLGRRPAWLLSLACGVRLIAAVPGESSPVGATISWTRVPPGAPYRMPDCKVVVLRIPSPDPEEADMECALERG